MGFNLAIGNAVPKYPDPIDGLEGDFSFSVETVKHDDAPDGTGHNDHSNGSYPSYIEWHRLVEKAGLNDVFFAKYGEAECPGLMVDHPGCRPLFPHHLERFRAARTLLLERNPNAIPRWEHGEDEAILAKVNWLIYWTEWALNNCEHPAFENG